jgi:acyl phosphate:glycerol-3-phosphate acyltransferase
MKFLFLLVISYLAGSVNFSLILFKFLGKDDPRNSFSGNAGTTNVYRMAGPVWAAVVLVLDVGRAVAVALLAVYALTPVQVPWTGLALIFGNRYPCFHGFQGGKGVANYLGFSAVITPAGTAVSAILWVLVYLLKREPFIASFAMIAVLAVGTIIANHFQPFAFVGTLATVLLILYNHRKNIFDLMDKKEKSVQTEKDED